MQTEHVAPESTRFADAPKASANGLTSRATISTYQLLLSLALSGLAGFGDFLSFRWLAGGPEQPSLTLLGIHLMPLSNFQGALGLHAVCASMAAFAALLLVPVTSRQPKLFTWGLSFLLCLAVPMLGVLLNLAAQIGFAFRTKHKVEPILIVTEPEFSIQRASAQQRRKVSTRVNVLDTTLSPGERINAQLALQDAPGKISADLLRSLLTDSVEDIRLLAYGLLDGKEKKISQRILSEQEHVNESREPQIVYAAHRRLAELNWELIYQRMVLGDMRRYSGDQSIEHARKALAIKPDDAGLWFLCARVLLSQERPDDAEHALDHARRLGLPEVQLLPYYAEMAFERRDLKQVQNSLGRLEEKPSSKALGAVYEYWN
jgi:polysaccharide biosynthesis protein PelE